MKTMMLGAALLLGTAMGAGAQDPTPDFTGTWIGDLEVVTLGRSADAKGAVTKVKVTYKLEHQEGRLVWGTVTADDGPGRPVALAFSLDNGTLVGSDTEGLHRLTIMNPTRLESCFTDNGSGAIIATCGIVTKTQ